ncbi:MAG: DUF4271 domain-containing protein [Flavobacterium sp.]|jgi:hypothetical protein|uniref:DUF4271 domain-containing protein n=1 Tax=Flavobacterium macrobrachii TaxID=591204 RepID=A0ABS2D1C5_9FLAO|nr:MULTISPECIES: DUF4271 domain-containing protein [Flavobacterium]MBM6500970.1 DUF4271 domain-containing protein [Flavobacterium macrobrachii]MCZ8330165.1 DUF4271 domain-containing protein [Flavobacterium sp.]PZO31480.1 MAG: DUF4271 domain-containing protein [Flavobacteriaceae bacterium]
MIETILNPRVIEPKDWATCLFILSFALIAITKTAFETRFNDFMRILVTDKYIKVYKDSSNLMSGFTVLLFIVQAISFSFFIQIALDYFGISSKYDWINFIRIFVFFGVFVLSKFLIEKIIATTFNIEEFIEQFNLQKVSYRTFIAIVLLPVNIYLFYNNSSYLLIYCVIGAILIINLLTYLVSLRIYQNLVIGNLFYFILYLCALEIAPYYFIYYLITKI